jgi:alkylated DNA nucleotide flippase Atl1
MTGARDSLRVFTLGDSIKGSPKAIEPSSFYGLGALEVQDVERWIRAQPSLLGEELLIVASQFAGFDRTKDRPDLLALDGDGKLVVIEIKRDKSGSGQDLQALRYAAYVSTLQAEQVVQLYRDYLADEDKIELSRTEAREKLEESVAAESLDMLDEDEQPRMILVAGGFQVGVTNTALWLTRNFGLDISCVQLTPYEIGGEVVLASSVLIPLPEAADYEVRIQEKRRQASAKKKDGARIDFEVATAFIASIPAGSWASYGDVAAAAGSPKGAQAIGTWLLNTGEDVPNVWRVLKRFGTVSPGWTATAAGVPPTPEAVRTRLAEEGVTFDEAGRASQDQRWGPEDWADKPAEDPGGTASNGDGLPG